ncbi:metallophosphoesterase [Microvirga aerilata]|uniref:Metallophosphoesterase n=1 Tax=Microvirga aerilata TaxID=670292 RepID=A0A936ZGU6_9HYPH|nr:metallophosphoesterase [Microvirga aerilata]MBL0404454.1 metallophosphoesterase [Microvirga aerilata]
MFDFVSDLHFDNGMSGGPLGWLGTIDVCPYKNPGSSTLLVAGDTSETVDDTIDFLNAAAAHYERVVAVLGNHEKGCSQVQARENVHILDLCGHEYRSGAIAYLGGCMENEREVEQVAARLDAVQKDSAVGRIIVLSHFVPTPRLCNVLGREFPEKCNRFLDLVSPPVKATAIVFGHVHLPYAGDLDGFQLFSEPRGYRGKRRDGSAWGRRFGAFP